MRKIRHIASIAVILMVQAAVLPQASGQRSTADKHYNNYEYALAIPYYKEMAEKGGKDQVYAMERLADSYRLTSQYAPAAEWYKKVVEQGNAKAEVYYNLGQVLRSQGRYEEAKVYLQRYVEMNPADPRGQVVLRFINEVQNWPDHEYVYTVSNAAKLNTSYSEFSPVYKDNKVIFTSDRMDAGMRKQYGWTGNQYLDLYESTGDGTDWSGPTPYGGTLNHEYHDGPAVFSGNMVMLTRAFPTGKGTREGNVTTHKLKLFSSYYDPNTNSWSKPEAFPYNNEAYSVGHPTLSADGNTLYFASDMPGGYGGTDLYRSQRTADGWSVPVNLGSVINTFGDEMFPYMYRDSALYFSTDGHPGYGGLDLFVSVKTGETFGAPDNLREPVNSPADDFGINFNPARREGMFSSNRQGGLGQDDIYMLNYRETFVKEITLSGEVTDKKTGAPIEDATVFVLDEKLGEVTVVKTGTDGKYVIPKKPGDQLVIKAVKSGYEPDCLSLVLPERTKDATVVTQALVLTKYELNQVFRYENIYYDFDKWNIRPDAEVELNKIVDFLINNREIQVELGSHTDSRGSHAYNEKLSQRRAESAVNYIVSKGVSQGRITAKGYGERELTNRCSDGVKCTEEEHQANRRTEIKITGFVQPAATETDRVPQYRAGQIIRLQDLRPDFFNGCK